MGEPVAVLLCEECVRCEGWGDAGELVPLASPPPVAEPGDAAIADGVPGVAWHRLIGLPV
jgi:hypothetical protein